jgi:hypothetical protein
VVDSCSVDISVVLFFAVSFVVGVCGILVCFVVVGFATVGALVDAWTFVVASDLTVGISRSVVVPNLADLLAVDTVTRLLMAVKSAVVGPGSVKLEPVKALS